MRAPLWILALTLCFTGGGCATPALWASLQEREVLPSPPQPLFASCLLSARDTPQALQVEVAYPGGATRHVAFTRNPQPAMPFADWPELPYLPGTFAPEPEGDAGRALFVTQVYGYFEGSVWLEDGEVWRLDAGQRVLVGRVPAIVPVRRRVAPARRSTARRVALIALVPFALVADVGIAAVAVGSVVGLIGLYALAKGC